MLVGPISGAYLLVDPYQMMAMLGGGWRVLWVVVHIGIFCVVVTSMAGSVRVGRVGDCVCQGGWHVWCGRRWRGL